MPAYLLYADSPEERNSNGINAVIANGVDAAAALAVAVAAAPNGETQHMANWTAVLLATAETGTELADDYVFLQGSVVTPLQNRRGQ